MGVALKHLQPSPILFAATPNMRSIRSQRLTSFKLVCYKQGMPKAVPPEHIEASIKGLFPQANAFRRPAAFEAFSHRVLLVQAEKHREAQEEKLRTQQIAPSQSGTGGVFGFFTKGPAHKSDIHNHQEKTTVQAEYAAALLAETMLKTTINLKRAADGIFDSAYQCIVDLEAQLTKAHEEALAEAEETITEEALEQQARARTQASLSAIDNEIRCLMC